MPLTVENREEFNPFAVYFIMCQAIIIAGLEMKFGDPVPEYCPHHHKMAHFHNGVIGTQGDLDHCGGEPLPLVYEDPLMPVARFTDNACALEDKLALEQALEDQPDKIFHQEKVSIENAGLLKTKDDLIAYAATFGITLKKATNISLKKMVENLKAEAVEKELI